MKMIRRKARNGRYKNGGFSLAEMLIAVGIIAVLSAVGFLNGVDMIRNSHQTSMDRQAEQIFLALSRNLQGLEASGYTKELGSKVATAASNEAESPLFLFKQAANDREGSVYAYTNLFGNETENQALSDLKEMLFPQSGLSAGLTDELENGYWLILFSPGADRETPVEQGFSAHVQEYIETTRRSEGIYIPDNLSNNYVISYYGSPTVAGVYFARSDETSADTDFLKIVDAINPERESDKSANYYESKEHRLNDTDGRVGYYGGDPQGILSDTQWDNFRCWFADVTNAEELSVTLACWIPDNPEYMASSGRHQAHFTLTIKGENSAAEMKLSSDVSTLEGNRVVTYSWTLDKLGERYHKKGTTGGSGRWGDQLIEAGFLPGENLLLTLSATNDDGVEAEFQDSDFTTNGVLKINSLFADDTTLQFPNEKKLEKGVLNAEIAYGRHLQNLNRGTSQVGLFGTNDAISEIHAVQTQDIYFSGPYPSTPEFDEDDEQWAATYNYQNGAQTLSKTFLPILNLDNKGSNKLRSYDGKYNDDVHTIYNLTVNYDNLAASSSSDKDDNQKNAGLFSSFGNGETADANGNPIDIIQNLTLVEPVIRGVRDTETVGGVAGICKATTLQNLTLIDPVICGVGATTQTAGGIAGTLSMKNGVSIDQCALYMTSGAGNGTVIHRAKAARETPETGMSWLTTGAGDGKNAGGLVGKATAAATGKTLEITESFASTVVKAGVGNADNESEWGANCHAGGLVGMADSVNVTINRCYMGSYLYGADTGGLVGGTSATDALVTVTNSYAAGFQYCGPKASGNRACGLVNGAVNRIDYCYSVSALNYGKNQDDYQNDDIANEIYSANWTDYCWKRRDFTRPWYHDSGEVNTRLGGEFISWADSQKENETNTYPYNLKDQSLLNYTYPHLRHPEGNNEGVQVYHGDWRPEVGILAYYELYDYDPNGDYYQGLTPDELTKEDYKYGFSVEALSCLKSGDTLNEQKGKIVADGYGVLFEQSVIGEGTFEYLRLSFGGTQSGNMAPEGSKTPDEVISIDLGNYKELTVRNVDYRLYFIKKEDLDKVNRRLHNGYPGHDQTFYQWVEVAQKKNAEGETEERNYYTFNPHFAMTPNMFPEPNGTSVTWKTIRDKYLVFQVEKPEIHVRTARQLYCLSKYYADDYYPILSGSGYARGGNVTFRQECDIDYRAYNWDDYAPQYLPDRTDNQTWADSDETWKDRVNWETYAEESTHYNFVSQDRGPDAEGNNQWDKAAFTQRPIAEKQNKPFVNAYDGDCRVITGLSVMASDDNHDTEKAIGLFGWNGSQSVSGGKIENVVFVTPFDRDDLNSPYVVGRKKDSGNEIIYLGALAGYNSGEISNCATAGYYLAVSGNMREPSELWTQAKAATDSNHIRVLEQSEVYAGGFAGWNDGTIQNASVSAPRMFAYIHLAHAYVGGFAGWSDGQISDAYSLGWVDADSSVQTSDGDFNTSLAGFCAGAGRSAKTIRNSYCAVAITGSGTFKYTNAFAPSAVKATSCYYLYGPVAKYLTELHNYDASSDRGTPRTETQLRKLAAGKTVAVLNDGGDRAQYWHDMPESEWKAGYQAEGYPYPAYVTRTRNGVTVRCHYGNWLEKQSLGQMGMFYWEHEEGGSNAGYHISFLGVYHEDENEAAVTKPITGSTLCIRHNDDGVIQTYGYGYYRMSRNVSMPKQPGATNIDYSKKTYNEAAKDALQEQWPDYYFYPYTTRTAKEANGGDYITLIQPGGQDNIQNGAMTLSGKAGDVTLTGKYAVSPFFANALRITEIDDGQTRTDEEIQEQIYGDAKDYTAGANVLEDGEIKTRTKNFHEDLGGEKNRYEIRSLRQLQYINWNHKEQTTTKLVTPENKTQFNYLTYWTESDTEKKKIDTSHTNYVGNYEPSNCYWWQTHDAVAPAASDTAGQKALNRTDVEKGGALFTPIAGATVSSAWNNYNSKILAWFGGKFDGQSYVLKNVEIHSDSFTIGVFGATVSADIQNVILYSDRYNMIERVTKAKEGQVGEKEGAYMVGGMVGLAYAYNPAKNVDPVTNKELVISNCAISGYQIVDSSTNPGGLGDANVGGLLGAAYATIKNCSSVVDIRINCTHMQHAQYGSYTRTGGLVGAIQYKAENCYSGGNIYIGEYADADGRAGKYTNTLYEMVLDGTPRTERNAQTGEYYWLGDGTPKLLTEYLEERENGDTRMLLYRRHMSNIYVGGIAGSTFGAEYLNFTGSGRDRQAEFVNCYTYMNLPKIEGNIRAVSYMGNVADRYGSNSSSGKSKVTQTNCWYLNGISPDAKDREGNSDYQPAFPFNLHWYTALESQKYFVTDEAGETQYQNVMENGQIKYQQAKNPDGTLKYEQAVDEDGNPLYEPLLDNNKNPVVDEDGNPKYQPLLDKDGKPVVDEEGNPQYKPVMKPVYSDIPVTQVVTGTYAWGAELTDEQLWNSFKNTSRIQSETVNPQGITVIDSADRNQWDVKNEPNNPRNWGDLGDILLGNISSLKKIQYNDEHTYQKGETVRCAPAPYLPQGESYEDMKYMSDDATSGMRYELNNKRNEANADSSIAIPWKPVTNATGTANLEGRYSFPGSDEKLLGADYPFPTIIKQYDPVSKDVVYVHYGQWPLDGAYWQAYLATMDIFGDNLGQSGDWWAEKKFTLCNVELTKLADGSFEGEPEETDFTFSDGAVAKFVKVERKNLTRVPNTTNRYSADYEVTIRALKRGNTQVMYAYDKSVTTFDSDGNEVVNQVRQERTFKLTVTAGEIETGGNFQTGDLLTFASNKNLERDPGVTFELYAKRKKRTEQEPDLDFTQQGVWSETRAGLEIDKALPGIQAANAVFLNIESNGARGRYKATTDGNPGEFYIASTFTYNYHNLESLSIPVTTNSIYAFGALGLANDPKDGSKSATYSHVERVSSAGTVKGASPSPAFTSKNKPDNPTAAPLFLYETATDEVQVTETAENGETIRKMVPALQRLEIIPEKIRLTDIVPYFQDSGDNSYYYPYSLRVTLGDEVYYIKPSVEPDNNSEVAEGDAHRTFEPDIALNFNYFGEVVREEGANYQYRGISVQPLTNRAHLPENLELTLVLKDPDPDSDAVYSLTAQIQNIGYGVTYDTNDPGTPPVSGDDPTYIPVPTGGDGDGNGGDTGGNGGGNTSSSGGGTTDNRYNHILILNPNGGTVTVNDTAWDNGNGPGLENGKPVQELFIYSAYRDGQYYATLPKVTGERDDGSFDGWSFSPTSLTPDYPVDESGQVVDENGVAAEIPVNETLTTLYAHWTSRFVTVNFWLDENTRLGSQMISVGMEKTLKSFSEMLAESNQKREDGDKIPLNFFFTGWEDAEDEDGKVYEDKGAIFFNEETELETLDLRAVTLDSIPVDMVVNGKTESHLFTRDDDGGILIDRYQNPDFSNDVALLGWYAGTGDAAPTEETATEVLRATNVDATLTEEDGGTSAETGDGTPTEANDGTSAEDSGTPTETVTGAPLKSADGTPLDMEIMLDADELAKRYQESGALTLYNKCLTRLPKTETKKPDLGENMGKDNNGNDELKKPSFIEAFENVSFPDGDKLEISMTLHGYNAKDLKQNLLSVGTEAGVKDWDEREQAIHFTYPRDAKNHYIRISNAAKNPWWDTPAPLRNFADDGSVLTVIIDKSGVEIQVNEGKDENGVDIIKSAKKNADTSASMNYLLKAWEGDNKLYVAAIEGDSRTRATDYEITLTRELKINFNQPAEEGATTIPPEPTEPTEPETPTEPTEPTEPETPQEPTESETQEPEQTTPETQTEPTNDTESGETQDEKNPVTLSGETPDEQTQTQEERTDNGAALTGSVSGATDDDATLYGAKPESAPNVPDADSDAALYGSVPTTKPDNDATLYAWTPKAFPLDDALLYSWTLPATLDSDAALYGSSPLAKLDDDATLYGSAPKERPESPESKENPENELPTGWNG